MSNFCQNFYKRSVRNAGAAGEKGQNIGKGIHSKVKETPGFWYLGHSNCTICSLLSWFCSQIFPPSWSLYWGVQFLISPERGARNEKGDSLENECNTGVLVPGAFKLDHFQPVELILFQNYSIFLTFILGGQISYYSRERKKGGRRGWKWEKGNHPKVNEKQGFLYLGHSNWTTWFAAS